MKKRLRALILVLIFSLSTLNATYPKVALVLSGGGAKGLAQIPIVEGIQELGIPIDFICGTSMGGLVGGYYALGYSTEDIIHMLKENPLIDAMIYSPPLKSSYSPSFTNEPKGLQLSLGVDSAGIGNSPGLISDQGVLSFINKTTIKSPGDVDFDDLHIPYKAVAVNVATGEEKIIETGYISDAMRATMSLPIIFPPYLLKDGTYCMDGGLVDNLPVKVAKEWGADIIISVDVSYESLKTNKEFSTLSGIIIQTMVLATFNSREGSLSQSDIVIMPDVSEFMILDVGSYEEILKKGSIAFEENKDKFIEIRDEISKHRDIEIRDNNSPSYYSQIKDPLITEIHVNDITSNNQNYFYINRIEKYVGKRLTKEALNELDKEVKTFASLNGISTVSYNFNPKDKENNSGVLELGLRSWDNSPSKLGLLAAVKLGLSSNVENFSWFYFSSDINTQLKDVFAEKMALDLRLTFAESNNIKAKIGYQFFSSKDKELTLSFHFGGKFGSLSPANNKNVKYYIPSSSVGLDVGIGCDFRLSNKLSSELLFNYNLVSLGRANYHGVANQKNFENPVLNILSTDLNLAFLDMDESLFAAKGFGVKALGSLKVTDGEFNFSSFIEGCFNLQITSKDTLKIKGNFGYSTANYQLTSSYFDMGGYSGIPGSYLGHFTREYFLTSLSYQRYLGDYIAPLYIQAGIKFFGHDLYNPIKNINPIVNKDMMISPLAKKPSIDNLGLGFFSGVGFKTNFGDIVFGVGLSINGNFSLVVEFV